jgi:competence protein ComEA
MAREPVDLVDDAVAPAEPRRPAPPPSLADLAARLGSVARSRVGALAAVALLGVGAVAAGGALLREPELPPTEELLPYAPGSEVSGAEGAGTPVPGTPRASTTVPASVVVHAAGAVAVPGIHSLPPGSRVSDLLAAAGGPAPDADLDRVNLAAPVGDGERVWFPRVGEDVEPPVVAGAGGGASPGGGSGPPALVDLNTATAEELDALPGIGPATASAILEHRAGHGPFASVDGLLDVPGIGEAKLAQLRDLVTV